MRLSLNSCLKLKNTLKRHTGSFEKFFPALDAPFHPHMTLYSKNDVSFYQFSNNVFKFVFEHFSKFVGIVIKLVKSGWFIIQSASVPRRKPLCHGPPSSDPKNKKM